MLSTEKAAQLLSHCASAPVAVSELTQKIKQSHDTTINLVRQLEAGRLLERTVERRARGRPRHLIRTTSLGEEFVRLYNRLLGLRLFSNSNDISKAIRLADLTERVVALGVDPYERFLEINQLAGNISRAA
jgi:predicted transcriptional regulator